MLRAIVGLSLQHGVGSDQLALPCMIRQHSAAYVV